MVPFGAMPTADPGLTIAAAAARLGIGRTSLYKLMSDGELEYDEYPTLGRRVTEDQIQAFLDAHRTTRAS